MTRDKVLQFLKENDINGITYYDKLDEVISARVPENFGGVEALISNAYGWPYNFDDCEFSLAIVCGALGFTRDIILDTDYELSPVYENGTKFLSELCHTLEEIISDAKDKGINIYEE